MACKVRDGVGDVVFSLCMMLQDSGWSVRWWQFCCC